MNREGKTFQQVVKFLDCHQCFQNEIDKKFLSSRCKKGMRHLFQNVIQGIFFKLCLKNKTWGKKGITEEYW